MVTCPWYMTEQLKLLQNQGKRVSGTTPVPDYFSKACRLRRRLLQPVGSLSRMPPPHSKLRTGTRADARSILDITAAAKVWLEPC